MEKMEIFGQEVFNLVDLIDVVCGNILDSNYFLTGETLDVDLIGMVKPYLNENEMKEFEEFLDKL